jgi:hypothetical protein
MGSYLLNSWLNLALLGLAGALADLAKRTNEVMQLSVLSAA